MRMILHRGLIVSVVTAVGRQRTFVHPFFTDDWPMVTRNNK